VLRQALMRLVAQNVQYIIKNIYFAGAKDNTSKVLREYIYIRMYIHTHIHTYTHTYIHTYMHTYIHTCMHTYIHTYMHAYIQYIHTDT
jgi:hypothetical protein